MNLLKANINNKGFTLIEVVCSVTMFSIIALMEIKLLFNYIAIVDETVECGKFYSSAEDTLNFISDRIDEGKCHEIKNDEIIVHRNVIIDGKEIPKEYCIKMENENIKIIYKTMGYYDSTEVVMEDVDSFKVLNKGNLIYLYLGKNGEELQRCFKVVNEKT